MALPSLRQPVEKIGILSIIGIPGHARMRHATGRPDAIVHPVGGLGCCEGPTVPSTPADIEGMVRAAQERGAPGASLYDYVTTGDDLWAPLQAANGL